MHPGDCLGAKMLYDFIEASGRNKYINNWSQAVSTAPCRSMCARGGAFLLGHGSGRDQKGPPCRPVVRSGRPVTRVRAMPLNGP